MGSFIDNEYGYLIIVNKEMIYHITNIIIIHLYIYIMSALWNELHKHALEFTGTNDSIFIAKFSKKIPRYTSGCSCQEFWNNWVYLNPPTYNDYFAWTVKAHNAVNAKLHKPQISVEDAIKIYKPTIE
jgi:hypothetical protein